MGVTKLLPMLQSVTDQVHISKYAGKVVGIEAAGWLYKGAYSCAAEVVQGKDTNVYMNFSLRMIKLLQQYEITPVFVFDGAPLPAKAETNAIRNSQRREAKEKALKMEKTADKDHEQLARLFNLSTSVTNKMIRKFMEVLRRMDITFYVAPYEADAQLAFMSRNRMVDVVIMEDADSIPYGCKKVLMKWTEEGWASEIQQRSLGANEDFSFLGWTEEMLIQLCILAGCDYCPTVPEIGISNAYLLVHQYRQPQDIVQAVQAKKKEKVPVNFVGKYYEAILTYRHHLVFDPRDEKLKMLNPLTLSQHILPLVSNDLFFLGDMEQSDELILSISHGLVHPRTHESYAWEDIYAELAKELSPDGLKLNFSGQFSSRTSLPATNSDVDQAYIPSSEFAQKRGSANSTKSEGNGQIKKQRIDCPSQSLTIGS